ncbi:hypothetical protein L6164_019439 [Bauhinia variegata]|uniref:Uncharacterized protein n=1 Tax=Bauhinia variegata TaxID=167791 RepID=A0ACB9MRP7_BAUVA|nr:hypothetical protein L6164_019439 [Bauhinia variegata]
MSSDLYVLDASFHRHSSSDMASPNGGGDLVFFSDSYPFPFCTVSPIIDIAQENSNSQTQEIPLDEIPSLDPLGLSPSLFSFSPPSSHLESWSLYQANPVQPLSTIQNLDSEFGKFSVLDGLEAKSEECQMGVDYNYNHQFATQSYGGAENVSKFMQRSFSSKSFDAKPGFLCQPQHETVMDSPNFQTQALSSPENSFFNGQMRRVCSTGDLQSVVSPIRILKSQTRKGLSWRKQTLKWDVTVRKKEKRESRNTEPREVRETSTRLSSMHAERH